MHPPFYKRYMYLHMLILLVPVPLASLVVGGVRLGVASNCSTEWQIAELTPPIYFIIYGLVSLLLVAGFMVNLHYIIQHRSYRDGVPNPPPHTQLWHIITVVLVFNLAWFIVARLGGEAAYLDCESSASDSTMFDMWVAVAVWEMLLTVASLIYLLVILVESLRK